MEGKSVPLRTRIAFLAMCIGTFMAILDANIVACSVPDIAANLGATIKETSWIQTAFLIAEAIMLPLSGWLSRSLSLRNLYSIAAAFFTLTSILCSLSWSIESLIVARICQGLCSGILGPLLYQGIFMLFPKEQQPGVTLLVVLIVCFAPVFGPTIGGWINQNYSWRWIFIINILPGILVTGTVFGLMRSDGVKWDLLKQFDYTGIALIAIFLGSLGYVFGDGPDKYWFDSFIIVSFSVVACTAVILLVWRELTCRHPVINLRAFIDRNFSIGCLLNFLIGLGLNAQAYTMIIFLSSVKEFNSQQIGRVLSTIGVVMVLSVPIVRFSRRFIGARTCLAFGLFLFGVSLWMNCYVNAETGFYELFLIQVPRGLSIMFCMSSITELALGRLPIEAVPNASGLYSLMRSLGGGIGIAVINYLIEQRLALHYSRLAVSLNPATFYEYLEKIQVSFADRMADMEHAGWGAGRILGKIVRRESMVMACLDMWLLLFLLFVVMLFLVPAVQIVKKR